MASRPSGRGGKPPDEPKRSRLGFEARLKLLCVALLLPGTAIVGVYLFRQHASLSAVFATLAAILLPAWVIALVLLDHVIRPVQTLSNVVGALREDDFAFRARGAQSPDAMGELAHEVNELAATLQERRTTSMEAAALLQRVVESMDTPVLAFDLSNVLRLLNPAAERLFELSRAASLGHAAEELGLAQLLGESDEGVVVLETRGRPARWMLHRTTFRQRGVPHTLFLLSDVSAALREEERQAWQRLIRVLGHEINNSLAPIKSIAGSLRSQIVAPGQQMDTAIESGDVERGLGIIEARAESLHRFVQAYRRLAQLPPPAFREIALHPLLERTLALETRVAVELDPGPPALVYADPDQLEQMFINLLRNAVEAAQMEAEHASNGAGAPPPHVLVSCHLLATEVEIQIDDNGAGITNPTNLFVPFYTTKPGGTGVGLALARQIAEAHGGALVLSNRDAGGCRATVVLPRARALSS